MVTQTSAEAPSGTINTIINSFINTKKAFKKLYIFILRRFGLIFIHLLFFDWRWIKINPKRLKIKMYSFLKVFLVLMKLLSLSQFYAPKIINSLARKASYRGFIVWLHSTA